MRKLVLEAYLQMMEAEGYDRKGLLITRVRRDGTILKAVDEWTDQELFDALMNKFK